MANPRVVYAPVFPDNFYAPAFLPSKWNPRHVNGAGLAGAQLTGFDASNPTIPSPLNAPVPAMVNGVTPENFTGAIQIQRGIF